MLDVSSLVIADLNGFGGTFGFSFFVCATLSTVVAKISSRGTIPFGVITIFCLVITRPGTPLKGFVASDAVEAESVVEVVAAAAVLSASLRGGITLGVGTNFGLAITIGFTLPVPLPNTVLVETVVTAVVTVLAVVVEMGAPPTGSVRKVVVMVGEFREAPASEIMLPAVKGAVAIGFRTESGATTIGFLNRTFDSTGVLVP